MSDGTQVARLSMEELAGRVWENQATRGVRYAQRPSDSEKCRARRRLVSLFHQVGGGVSGRGLALLTMPGLEWTFERDLLAIRESPKKLAEGTRGPRRTFIESIEADEAIYRASLKWIPGHWSIQHRDPIPGSTATLRTPIIQRYHRITFEDYAKVDAPMLDGAWLDFNGQLTDARLEGLARLWPRLRKAMAVTVMMGRDKGLGGIGAREAAIRDAMPKGTVIDCRTYRDTVPMLQMMILKEVSRG